MGIKSNLVQVHSNLILGLILQTSSPFPQIPYKGFQRMDDQWDFSPNKPTSVCICNDNPQNAF